MKNKARNATKKYHQEMYSDNVLFKKGSWLAKPKAEIIEVVERDFADKANIRVLDLGSGIGRNAIPIAKIIGKLGGRVTCVDYLDLAIKKLLDYASKYKVPDFIEGIVSPIEKFVIESDTYDFIIAHSVLTHVENKKVMAQLINNMAKGVKKNGIIYINMITNLQEFDVATDKERDPEAEVEISFDEASKLLRKVFNRWEIQTLNKNLYQEKFYKGEREILWKADYLLFIAKNTT
ncbi:MAG TPA: class I SAM-dependent methyltransferase [bacterium]|nr:class I SAM-dependent methyltransferase [bacterium]